MIPCLARSLHSGRVQVKRDDLTVDYFEMSAGQGRTRVVPYFQPIISVADGQIYGYEVLGRFRSGIRAYFEHGALFCGPPKSPDMRSSFDRARCASLHSYEPAKWSTGASSSLILSLPGLCPCSAQTQICQRCVSCAKQDCPERTL
jgi:predicted signal transduction protein with EAL and GGDEF domain